MFAIIAKTMNDKFLLCNMFHIFLYCILLSKFVEILKINSEFLVVLFIYLSFFFHLVRKVDSFQSIYYLTFKNSTTKYYKINRNVMCLNQYGFDFFPLFFKHFFSIDQFKSICMVDVLSNIYKLYLTYFFLSKYFLYCLMSVKLTIYGKKIYILNA